MEDKLSIEEIEKLSSRKGVRKIAVENFLISLNDASYSDAMANLRRDADLYKWSALTRKAISDGIRKAYLKK